MRTPPTTMQDTDVHYYYFSYCQGGTRHFIKRVNVHEAAVDYGDLFSLRCTAVTTPLRTFSKEE